MTKKKENTEVPKKNYNFLLHCMAALSAAAIATANALANAAGTSSMVAGAAGFAATSAFGALIPSLVIATLCAAIFLPFLCGMGRNSIVATPRYPGLSLFAYPGYASTPYHTHSGFCNSGSVFSGGSVHSHGGASHGHSGSTVHGHS